MIVSANLAAFSLAPWFSLEAVYKKAYFKVSSQHPTYCVYCAAGSTAGKEVREKVLPSCHCFQDLDYIACTVVMLQHLIAKLLPLSCLLLPYCHIASILPHRQIARSFQNIGLYLAFCDSRLYNSLSLASC